MVQPKGIRCLLIALWLALAMGGQALAAGADELAEFARRHGIKDTAQFVLTIETLDRTGKLPSTYVSKDEAERLGWKPGRDLSSVAPGKMIGGDPFANRERRLPAGIRYREADLDYQGGPRNAKRLIVGSDGERWVTVDHYRSFHKVPK
jgi:ribonuclease T1